MRLPHFLRAFAVGAALVFPIAAAAQSTVSPGAYSGTQPTIGTSDQTILAANSAFFFLDLINNSPTATVCISFGATATISGSTCASGEITLAPLAHRSWETDFIPNDAVHAIASAASVPFTIGAK